MESNNNTVPKPNYKMIPNICVQNITDKDGVLHNSYIQLFGKKTVSYLYCLLEIQNMNGYIHFSINMVLWLLRIESNLKRERMYFKEFLQKLKTNSLIEFVSDPDIESLASDDFVTGKLNIYEYNDKGKSHKYFQLLNSEYDKIMNGYSGKLDRYNLLNLFCNIKSRIKRNEGNISPAERKPEVAYPSYETISDDIFIDNQKTLKEYIDCLVNLDLIRYDYAGDMIFKLDGQQPVRRKANFTYALFGEGWEEDLNSSIVAYRSKKHKDGWSFTSKENEATADEKRSITQKINSLQKKKSNKKITQSEKKELSKLLRKKQKWQYDNNIDARELEEKKLKTENPGKNLSEVYDDMGCDAKADRAYEEELTSSHIGTDVKKVTHLGLSKPKPFDIDKELDDMVDAHWGEEPPAQFSDDVEDEDITQYLNDDEDYDQELDEETRQANFDQMPEDVKEEYFKTFNWSA